MITMAVYDWFNDLAQLSHSIATVKPFHSSSWSHRFPDTKSGRLCVFILRSADKFIWALVRNVIGQSHYDILSKIVIVVALSCLEISHIHVFSDFFNADADYVVAQAP